MSASKRSTDSGRRCPCRWFCWVIHRRHDSSDRILIPKDATHSQGPILDLPITLAKEKRTAEQTIALICQKLNEKSKIPVTVNADAGNVRWRATVTVGGREAPARALLSRTRAAMGDHLSWRLLYAMRRRPASCVLGAQAARRTCLREVRLPFRQFSFSAICVGDSDTRPLRSRKVKFQSLQHWRASLYC
jgi:hypothetical protein